MEMANDLVRLLDHLQIERAHIVGYSMGGALTNLVRAEHPDRVLTATIGGMGWAGENGENADVDADAIAAGLEEADLGPLFEALAPPGEPGPSPATLWLMNTVLFSFNDPRALAAALRGMRANGITARNLADNTVPSLALIGERDPILRQVDAMAAVMANLEVVTIPGATHMTAFSDQRFTDTLISFLDKHRS